MIPTCFKKADFCSPIVKILANTGVLAAFLPCLTEKSALLKISDLKAWRFRVISASFSADMLAPIKEKRVESAEMYCLEAGSDCSRHLGKQKTLLLSVDKFAVI